MDILCWVGDSGPSDLSAGLEGYYGWLTSDFGVAQWDIVSPGSFWLVLDKCQGCRKSTVQRMGESRDKTGLITNLSTEWNSIKWLDFTFLFETDFQNLLWLSVKILRPNGHGEWPVRIMCQEPFFGVFRFHAMFVVSWAARNVSKIDCSIWNILKFEKIF